MERQEGYYWVRYRGNFIICEWTNEGSGSWILTGTRINLDDSIFDHINEVRIKALGEIPD